MEYRVWNPFRSKLAAGVLGGLDNIYIQPGKKVLYMGAASGTSVSHVADIVGPVSTSAVLVLVVVDENEKSRGGLAPEISVQGGVAVHPFLKFPTCTGPASSFAVFTWLHWVPNKEIRKKEVEKGKITGEVSIALMILNTNVDQLL